jgi:gamma-glutamylcyclotransferase (GGCT)/AIG2-like uncharacterized protein YtfP
MKKALFFVYGTLCKGHGNHYLLENTKYYGEHNTEPIYTLYTGSFPIVERGGETSIKGQLFYTENENIIKNVFRLEGCSFEQNSPDSWYTYDLIDTPFGKAIIFVMDKGKSRRTNIVKSGKWY